jgi:hypothetical protein
MAKARTQTDKEGFKADTLPLFERQLFRDWREDLDAHDDQIQNFEAYEAMHNGQTYDPVSRSTDNGLTDNMTATIYLERAARVAGQLPEGEVKAFGRKDKGKALFMDMLRQKWIYPNANAQRPFKTKMFLWQYGSSEYGYMPMHYDLNVTPQGYFGPDCWLWNPRMFVPQNGFVTVSEMDYVHALANKSYSFFEEILEDPDTNFDKEAIRKVKDALKNATLNPDSSRENTTITGNMQSRRQILVATRYEAGKKGRWITFLPDFGYTVIRNIPNPHKNGKIPFVIKPCIPSFDTFYGVGDFQRSMPMQFANDGLDNFYFQGIKINLFPPTVANAQTMIRHTMSQEPGAIWEVNGNPADIKRLDTSTAGLSTYQSAKGMAKGALQSIAGTTDTRANAENSSDPGFGKTPEALKMMSARESTRDNQDRELLEAAMTELLDGMMSLIPTIKNKIPLDIFADEIADIIEAGHTDLKEIFKDAKKSGFVTKRMSESKEQARLKIDPSKFEGMEFRFELHANSTAKKTREEQLQGMIDYMNFLGKMPNALEQYREFANKVPDWQKFSAKYGELANIQGLDELFMDVPTPEAGEGEGEQGGQGAGITPEQLAQAAASDPNAIAQGAMNPQQPPMPQAPPQMPQPQMPPQAPPQFVTPDMVGMGGAPQPPVAPAAAPQLHPVIAATLQEYERSRAR